MDSAELQLRVLQTGAAPARVGLWLAHLLTGPLQACNVQGSYPIELRPTGSAAGWCSAADYAPDGRVCLSSRAILWRPASIVATVLHELAHRLIEKHGQHDHNAAFFALQAVLYLRAEASATAHKIESPFTSLALRPSLYDLQDPPEPLSNIADRGVGRSISWSLEVAAELCTSPLTAEACAAEIHQRYLRWIDHLTSEPHSRAKAQAAAQARAARQAQEHAQLRTTVSALKFYLGAAIGTTALLMTMLISASCR